MSETVSSLSRAAIQGKGKTVPVPTLCCPSRSEYQPSTDGRCAPNSGDARLSRGIDMPCPVQPAKDAARLGAVLSAGQGGASLGNGQVAESGGARFWKRQSRLTGSRGPNTGAQTPPWRLVRRSRTLQQALQSALTPRTRAVRGVQ